MTVQVFAQFPSKVMFYPRRTAAVLSYNFYRKKQIGYMISLGSAACYYGWNNFQLKEYTGLSEKLKDRKVAASISDLFCLAKVD